MSTKLLLETIETVNNHQSALEQVLAILKSMDKRLSALEGRDK